MLLYFVSFWLNRWNSDLGLEMERHHIASFDVGGDESLASKSSLWEWNLFGDSKIEADLWPGQRPASVFPFQNGSSTFGILNKSTVSAKFTCDDLCGESENYWERYFARIKCGNIVPGWLWIVLSVPRTCLIVWFPEVVDRQISGTLWRSCYKNTVYKHKNALWVLSWSNFVLDNRLWGQERWILDLF